jgi:predicted ATPase/DNA-binding SARP family transcriptional activator
VGNISSLFEICLLGTPRLLLNGASVDSLRRKNRALLFYIAAQGRPVTREKLLAFFWPDHERPAAQPILRTMIHDLHKHLGEAFQADDRNVALSPDIFIDVQFFPTALHASLDSQKLAEVLDLYKGDFLEGFSLSDASQFDEWAATERERYRLMAMNGFADLSHRLEADRQVPAALDSARRALAFNPFQEDLQRDVMRLLYLNGDRAGVIRQYEGLCKLLDEELGVPPMPETRALYDTMINETYIPVRSEASARSAPRGTAGDPSLLPFLGREAEMETLRGQLGSGRLILLEGEAGIGKTRLLAELIASHTRARDPLLVLQGISYELEQGLPYQPLVDALRKLLARTDGESLFARLNIDTVWLTELSRLLPELPTRFPNIPAAVPPADEPRLWEALLRFFQGLSSLQEVWIFLDDLHWADAATLAWLGYLIRRGSSPTLNVLATCRPLEDQATLIKLLQALQREDRLVRITLSLLPEAAMKKMAAALSRKQGGALSSWLIRNAEGNPFFLTELVRYAYAIGLLKPDGALDIELMGLSPAIPATIQNLVASRLLKRSEQAQRTLHIAAIIGRQFDFELLKQVTSLSEAQALDAIEELQAAHLIAPLPDDQFAFDHSLTMEVALSDMSATRRRSLHRRVAEALESLHDRDPGPVSGLIAHHFLEGNLPERAKSYAFRAGQRAADLAAWVEAIAFFQQAIGLELDATGRARMLLALGAAHFHKGDFALSTHDYRTAIQLAQGCQDWPLLEQAHVGLNLSLLPQARFAEAVQAARELRQAAPPGLALCAEFIWGASLGVESAHPTEAESHLRTAERLLQEQSGTFRSQVTSLQIKYSLAGVYGQQGRSLEAVDEFRQVLEMLARGEGSLDTLRNIMLYNNLAYHLHLVGDASAADYLQAGIRLARERGSLSHLPYLYSTSGEIALAQGDLQTAETHFQEGLDLARQIPLPERIAGMTANLGLVAIAQGQTDLGRERLQSALALVRPLGNGHLEVRIRLWLAPLLSETEARQCLEPARLLAEQGGLAGLLEEIGKLEKNLG